MFTRARLAGLWILGSVISPAELEHLDDYSLAIDGDGGGTYAPSTAIVIGGSGVTLSGASHHLSGTLTVDNLAVISIASGGTVKAEGTGTADITLAVVSGVATMTVGSGAVVKIQAGGALDVYGALTIKDTSGPGTVSFEDHTTLTLLSGATMSAASGSTVNINGTGVVRGTLTIESSSPGPGSLVVEAGTTNQLAGLLQVLTTAEISHTSGSTLSGTTTDSRTTSRTGKTTRAGSGARVAQRAITTLPDSAADVTVADDTVRVRQSLTTSYIYTLRHTGTVPTAGERIHSYRSGTTTPNASLAVFEREDTTILFTYAANKQGWATFEFDGTDWQLIAWAQFASGDASGAYGNVW